MTLENDGGILHGSWSVPTGVINSDRRLKTNIMPLQRTLRDVIAPKSQTQAQVPANSPVRQKDGALWLLRQLRPVSYKFRAGPDSKHMRFGFIADELENVVPEVVRSRGDRDVKGQKAVVYEDLIALLFATKQSQQSTIDRNQNRMMELEKRLTEYEEEVKREEDLSRKVRSFRRWQAKRLGHVKTTTTTMLNLLNATNMTKAW